MANDIVLTAEGVSAGYRRHSHILHDVSFAVRSGEMVGIIGATQASEALKILTGAGEPAHGKLKTYNALTGKWQEFLFTHNRDCNVCAKPESDEPCR